LHDPPSFVESLHEVVVVVKRTYYQALSIVLSYAVGLSLTNWNNPNPEAAFTRQITRIYLYTCSKPVVALNISNEEIRFP